MRAVERREIRDAILRERQGSEIRRPFQPGEVGDARAAGGQRTHRGQDGEIGVSLPSALSPWTCR